MKFLLAKKLAMSQKFTDDGTVIPVTVVVAKPCYITQIKSADKDGYRALQIGCGLKKKINKALTGHLKDMAKLAKLKEFTLEAEDQTEYKRGQEITLDIFKKGDIVKVTGPSKGRGFQGVVKRHGFSGHKETHGTKDQVRASGSIGATGPAHVFKGIRMPGRMGGKQVSISNLEIIDLDPAKNLIYIKGAIPGSRNSLVEISAPGAMDLTVKQEKKEAKEPGVAKAESQKTAAANNEPKADHKEITETKDNQTEAEKSAKPEQSQPETAVQNEADKKD